MEVAFLFVLVIGLLLIGVPIAISLGLSSIFFLLLFSDTSLASIAQTLFEAFEGHFTLLAIPFFILASAFMTTGGVAKRIIRFAISLVGHFPGGLAIAGVFACMMFAALSGSSPATVVAVGTIVIAGMRDVGYSKDFAAGVICNAGTLGILIPPSIVMVVYAASVEVSVGRMFLAGVIPGLLAGLMLMVTIYVMAVVRNLPKGSWQGWAEVVEAMLEASWGLFLIVIILVGIYAGIFTPTEAAAVASVYAFIVAIFIYRDMGPLKGKDWLPEDRADKLALGFSVIGFSVVTLILYLSIAVLAPGLSYAGATLAALVFFAVAVVLGAIMAVAARQGWDGALTIGGFVVLGALPGVIFALNLMLPTASFMPLEMTGMAEVAWPLRLLLAIVALITFCLPPAGFLYALNRGAARLVASGGSYARSLAEGGWHILKGNAQNALYAIPAMFGRDTKNTLLDAGKLTVTLLFVIANALILKHVLTDEQVPQTIANAMLDAGFGKIMFLVIVNLILLIGGQFMEPSGLLVIVAPLVFPIAIELGVDPIHLGIIMVVNMEIGMITPPVGLNLFVTSGVAGMPMMRVVKAALPFLAVLFVFLILVTYIPILSTALPTAFMGPEIITR